MRACWGCRGRGFLMRLTTVRITCVVSACAVNSPTYKLVRLLLEGRPEVRPVVLDQATEGQSLTVASDTSSFEGGLPFSAESHGWGISISVGGESQ